MFKMIIYAVAYFLITLLIQYLLHKFRKNGNCGTSSIWTGRSAAIVICTIGIVINNVHYLGAVLGYLVADDIGKQMGWQ